MHQFLSNNTYFETSASGHISGEGIRTTRGTNTSVTSYEETLLTSRTKAQSPELLMSRLMEKACFLLEEAIISLNSNNTNAFHNASLHASQIILSMRCMLDRSSDERLTDDMFFTYTVIATTLKKARENCDLRTLRAIRAALNELRDAWSSIA